jgi:hypothetical protein
MLVCGVMGVAACGNGTASCCGVRIMVGAARSYAVVTEEVEGGPAELGGAPRAANGAHARSAAVDGVLGQDEDEEDNGLALAGAGAGGEGSEDEGGGDDGSVDSSVDEDASLGAGSVELVDAGGRRLSFDEPPPHSEAASSDAERLSDEPGAHAHRQGAADAIDEAV